MNRSPRLQMTTAMALAQELGLTSQIYNNRLAKLLKSKDITYPQYEILNHIMRQGSTGATIMEIAQAVEVLQPAVTKTVNKFTQRTFLLCKSDPKDKRIKRSFITPEGANFIGALQAALMPDVLTCFEEWDANRVENFTKELAFFRKWLEENRLN